MPSRMSCSLTTTSSDRQRVHDHPQHERPGADDVDPARVHHRQRRPPRRVAASSPAVTDAHGADRDPASRGWRPGRRPAAPSASAATVVTDPARPDQAWPPRRPAPRRGPRPARRGCRPRRGRSPRRVGGSPCRCRSVSRTQPMSTDRAARTPPASPSTNSVEPPPMSTTRNGGRGGGAAVRRRGGVERGGGAEEGQLGLLAARDDVRRLPERGQHHLLEVRAVGGVAGGAGGDHAHRRRPELAGLARRTRRAPTRVRSIASGASRPVASTPWPSRTTSIRRSRSVCAPVGRDVGDEQPDGVGAAVDGGDPGHARLPAPARRTARRPTTRPSRRPRGRRSG